MLDEKKLREELLNEVSDEKITKLSSSRILATYLDRKDIKEAKRKKRNTLLATLIPSGACAIALAIGLPIGLGGNGDDPFVPPDPFPPTPVTVSAQNEIAFSMLSVANFSNHMDNPHGSITLNSLQKAIQVDELDDKVRLINPYMYTAEQMLDYNLNLENHYLIYENTVDDQYSQYDYVMMFDDDNDSIFYFSEKGDVEYDDDEIEQEFRIDGLMILDAGKTIYRVDGSRELEQEDDEEEYELHLNIYFGEGRENRLEIQQEIETELNEKEISFVYTNYRNNRLIDEVEIGFEEDEGQFVEIETITDGNIDSSFFVRKNNDDTLSADYDLNGDRSTLTISIIDDGRNYRYVDASVGYDRVYERN